MEKIAREQNLINQILEIAKNFRLDLNVYIEGESLDIDKLVKTLLYIQAITPEEIKKYLYHK